MYYFPFYKSIFELLLAKILLSQYTIYNDHYAHYAEQLWPVLVWFNSGTFIDGAAQVHPGHVLATQEIVVVTVNYRLGALGILPNMLAFAMLLYMVAFGLLLGSLMHCTSHCTSELTN